jgi:small conductance mechanosensitive channel
MLTLPFQGEAPQEVTEQAAEYVEAAKQLALTHGPRVLAAIAILVIGWFVARFATGLVRKGMARANVDATLSKFISSLTYMLLMIFVVMAAISKLGVETASFIAVLGAAGFAVGFALQGSLSNFAAGVMILIFRPFKAGNFIEAGGTTGVVQEVGIFHTILTTPDNKKVIVANSSITGGNITNFSAMETRRVDMQFGIGYGDDIKKAKEILQRLMAADARVLKDPACTIAVSELGDSSVNLVCRPWVKSADYWAVFFDTHEKVKLTFDAEGISIPFPQRDVHFPRANGGEAAAASDASVAEAERGSSAFGAGPQAAPPGSSEDASLA